MIQTKLNMVELQALPPDAQAAIETGDHLAAIGRVLAARQPLPQQLCDDATEQLNEKAQPGHTWRVFPYRGVARIVCAIRQLK